MSLWCRHFPTVCVPHGATPKPITLVMPYYENPQFLKSQISGWQQWPSEVRTFVDVLVVDDGSPEPAVLPDDLLIDIRLFRIDVDIRWNWLAARNIGAHHAKDGWLLLTDIDHVVPTDTVRSLIFGMHDPGKVYAFARQEHTGEAITPHSASFFMTRDMFWKVGGYDERLSGYYGTDGVYRKRVAATAPIAILTDRLIRYERIGDSSTVRYGRKEAVDGGLRGLMDRLPKQPPKVLSFPYHEVTA